MHSLFKSRKAQPTGAAAATLVAVIALLIVLYILFLPPNVRDALLDGENATDRNGGSSSSRSGENLTLLLEHPGRLDYINQNELEIEHSIPSVNIYSVTEATLLGKADSLYARNNWFNKIFPEMSFPIDDLENINNVMLSFSAEDHEGILTIKLNDKIILSRELSSSLVDPIELPKDMLKDENLLVFEISGVNWKFWETNEYLLRNIKLTADVTDVTKQRARNIFTLSSTEKNNLKRAFLKFYPDCIPTKVDRLTILLNGHSIFSAVPDCGILRPIEFPTQILKSGENDIIFSTPKGSYLIDNVVIKTELKELTHPVYYFEINESQWEDLLDDDLDVLLKFNFVDDLERKQARLYINGHLTHLDTKESEYERYIDPLVTKGNNGLEIIPQTTLNIVKLEVKLK